jgi:hypothetical protein
MRPRAFETLSSVPNDGSGYPGIPEEQCARLMLTSSINLGRARSELLAKRLQVEDQRQDISQNAIRAVRIVPILIAVVVAIFVATLETFAKIVSVVFRVYVIAVEAIGRVLVGVTVPVVGTPVILTVGSPGAEALLVARIHRLP